MSMFCYQCEQTARGSGCTSFGACGKDPETAALQDLLMYLTTGISACAHRAGELGVADREIDKFVMDALFTTVTNVNFDPARMETLLREAVAIRDRARALYHDACRLSGTEPDYLNGPTTLEAEPDRAGMMRQGREVGIETALHSFGPDIGGLRELLLYGVKGMAAYVVHAAVLGAEDEKLYSFVHQALRYLAEAEPNADELLSLCLRCGEANYRAMELLNEAHIARFGQPGPAAVRITPVKGKAILVSGHDLHDLEALLQQTEGKGVNVYTHGEMLPAHGYPELRKYRHLVGNYGGAWQDQGVEFAAFPGAVLMTTNCIQAPKQSYKERIFTTGLVAWPGVQHVTRGDFSAVIAAAQAASGFAEDGPEQTITVGFGHHAVLGVADKVVAGVKSGAIRHFFLIGGCDGARPGRNYYTDFAEAVPDDCVIMTLACGKYRFNKRDYGTIDGIPRLLDVGQCNDAYSAIQIAAALAKAFDCSVNELPLSLILSWYEQKAVSILLTLLHLGIKNIRLGPTLPAFLSPAVAQIIVDTFGLKPIRTAAEDLQACLQEVNA